MLAIFHLSNDIHGLEAAIALTVAGIIIAFMGLVMIGKSRPWRKTRFGFRWGILMLLDSLLYFILTWAVLQTDGAGAPLWFVMLSLLIGLVAAWAFHGWIREGGDG
jgi:hypothetical protein